MSIPEQSVPSETARGDAFEQYCIRVLRAAYPNYAWYHQGRDKRRERGVDFVGNRLGDAHGEPSSIGVQVKFHSPNNAPTEHEWLKFLAGCFSRRLDAAVFVTTGKLTGEQRREAQEARVIVIEGRDEVTRLASQHGISHFELFDNESMSTSENYSQDMTIAQETADKARSRDRGSGEGVYTATDAQGNVSKLICQEGVAVTLRYDGDGNILDDDGNAILAIAGIRDEDLEAYIIRMRQQEAKQRCHKEIGGSPKAQND